MRTRGMITAVLVVLALAGSAAGAAPAPDCEPIVGAEALAVGPVGCPGARGLEALIMMSSIGAIPGPSPVDAVLSSARAHTSANASAIRSSLDEDTVLHGMALSQATGVPLGVRDLRTHAASASSGWTWINILLPDAKTITAALTLGVAPIDASGFDVSYAGFNALRGETAVARALPPDVTMGGLVLAGGGSDVDPRDLVSTQSSIASGAAVRTFPPPSIPPRGRDLAAQAAIAPIGGDSVPQVFAFSQRDIQHNETYLGQRDVLLDPEVAFSAVALARNGVAVDTPDTLTLRERVVWDTEEFYDRFVEPEVLRYWLVLGLRFE